MTDRQTQILFGAAALLCGAALFAYFAYRALFDPSIVFLRDDGNAEWIRFDRPTYLRVLPLDNQVREFEHSFECEAIPAEVRLELVALGNARVYVNNQETFPITDARDNWKMPAVYRIEPQLLQGRNSIRIDVINGGAPPACRAKAEAIGVATGAHWRVRVPGHAWTSAVHVNDLAPSELSRAFERSDRALIAIFPILLPIAMFGALAYGFGVRNRRGAPVNARSDRSAGLFRWLILAIWCGMAINNAVKLPIHLGFDVVSHLDYVFYVARMHALPSPSEGWQMFQAPLFYVVAAIPTAMFDSALSDEQTVKLLRGLTLVCGAAQIEIAYRLMRAVYPGRAYLQIMGTAFAALLPMNLYMSQFAGNDPLTGVLVGGAVAMTIAGSNNASVLSPLRHWILIGALLGLALLTKAHAVVAVVPIAGWLTWLEARKAIHERHSIVRSLARPGLVFILMTVIAGPYYYWAWTSHGNPFSLGTGFMQWWQDPGYRTTGQFASFGKSLTFSVASADKSFWDTLYSSFALDTFLSGEPEFERRPPWNDRFMLAGAWLGVIPVALIMIGALRSVVTTGTSTQAGWFVVAIIGAYLAALIQLNLELPVYQAAKASYTLGLIPAYAYCLTVGMDAFARWKPLMAMISGLLAAWGVAAGVAYFVW